jgi:response regulator of citrate/malate metabolism
MKKFEDLKFLIIDDDELFTYNFSTILESFSTNITKSENAENGSHFVSSLKPSIIFLDNNLPKISGIDVIQLYKEISPKSKVILMSSNLTLEEVENAKKNKADYIIDKGNFNEGDLYKILESVFLGEKEMSSVWKLLKVFVQKSVRKINISIVEDDELFSLLLSKNVKDICTNSKVETHVSGSNFKEYLKSNSPDLIFLDYYLTDSTGKDLLVYIKSYAPKAKTIVISSLEDPKIATNLVNQGIDGYIVKDETWRTKLKEYLEEFGFN